MSSFCLYGQNDAQLQAIYETGRRVIDEIITENNLKETLEGHAYGGFFINPSVFLIIKKGDSFYEVFRGAGRGYI